MKKGTLVIVLFFALLTNNSFAKASNHSTTKAFINVSVATLWNEPGITRDIDQSSLSNPVQIRKWLSSMSMKERLWLVGKSETQVLYGQEVKILNEKGTWVQVVVKDQGTQKNKLGYPGWMPKKQIIFQKNSKIYNKVAEVKSKTTFLYNNKKKIEMELSFNTRLPVLASDKKWVSVLAPNGTKKWLLSHDINIIDPSKSAKPDRSKMIQTAKTFLRLQYLWAGTSGFGYDCSGFTYSIYKHYNLLIPRDASEQFKKGTFVLRSKLKPGDLLFFANNNGKGSVHHVGMYIGSGKMIHSPKTWKSIEIVSIYLPQFIREYAGSRRYIH
jgi:gamma-D-glutamyl-L-lysine dipeptidyl-peptidase